MRVICCLSALASGQLPAPSLRSTERRAVCACAIGTLPANRLSAIRRAKLVVFKGWRSESSVLAQGRSHFVIVCERCLHTRQGRSGVTERETQLFPWV